LQQFADSLYKAALMPCRYSTQISDNAVERRYKRCPRGLLKTFYTLLQGIYLE